MREYWKNEPDSETTLRFKAYSRKVNVYAALIAVFALFVTVAATVHYSAFTVEGWNVLGFLALVAAVPAAVYVAVLRLANSAFMRRVLHERD